MANINHSNQLTALSYSFRLNKYLKIPKYCQQVTILNILESTKINKEVRNPIYFMWVKFFFLFLKLCIIYFFYIHTLFHIQTESGTYVSVLPPPPATSLSHYILLHVSSTTYILLHRNWQLKQFYFEMIIKLYNLILCVFLYITVEYQQ